MISKTIIHYKILEKRGEAYLNYSFGRQAKFVHRSLLKELKGNL
jgi:hypothetical protein